MPTSLRITFGVVAVAKRFPAQLALHQLLGAHPFGTRIDPLERAGDDLVVDTLGAELGGQRALALASMGPPGAHPLFGEVASSIRPTVVSRSSTVAATSSAYPRLASWPANSDRVRDRTVSRRRHSACACSSRVSEVDRSGQDVIDGKVRAVIGHHGADPELLLDLLLDLVGDIGVLDQEGARVLLALAQLLTLVGEPRPGLADEALLDTHVDQRALLADALAVEDVELGLLERRRDLVLDDLDPVRLPTASVLSLSVSMRRTSRRTEA